MKLAIGTAQMGMTYGIANDSGQVPLAEARCILETASASGVDMLDTAIAYGESEKCLGSMDMRGWHVVTKLPGLPDDCADVRRWVKQQVADSMSRLGVEELYALLLHRPADALGPRGRELCSSLLEIRETRKVRAVGASIYDPSMLESLIARFPLEIVQAPFNVVDRRLLRTGWLAALKDRGIEVHVRSAFMQGLLLMDEGRRPPAFSRWNRIWSAWHSWLRVTGQSAAAGCLGYLASFPEIDRIVVGVDGSQQLRQLLAIEPLAISNVPDSVESLDVDLLDTSRWSPL